MNQVVPFKSYEVKLFVNGVYLSAKELEDVILRGLDRVSIIADVVSIEEVKFQEVSDND